ncbi:unnamed protein product [Ilex paraguariensis]|uniref:Protein kinase domain-containing protein n=1 Tax=Ilex paraguariensis TaxID=185542 RepID=A0ABC8TCT7_9AQUA
MLQLDHVKFLTYPPEVASQVFLYISMSACRFNCLASGSCVASTSFSDGTNMCYLKLPDFVSGYQSPALPSTSYIKVCSPGMLNPSASSIGIEKDNGWKLSGRILPIAVIGTILGVVVLQGGLWWWCRRNNPTFGGFSARYEPLEYASGDSTGNKGFCDKLGEGGHGAVYRGILPNGNVAAVKQLEDIELGEKNFKLVIATIISTHHLNLVRVIGFCSERHHRFLVYELVKNGSLYNFIFMSNEWAGKVLNWQYRFNIALGTARGIAYLHEECRDCIIHGSIKPENILLDENYNAKVSDFGLAKLTNPNDDKCGTLRSVRGTREHVAPECPADLPITSKSDVYSYGMVLLEIVSGRRNSEVSAQANWEKLSLWAYQEYQKGNLEAIVDQRLLRHELDMEQVMRSIRLSFWCTQEQSSERPMMGKVVQMLEGIIEIDEPPAPKAALERSVSGSSRTSSNVNVLSTSRVSAPAFSSSSSSHANRASS